MDLNGAGWIQGGGAGLGRSGSPLLARKAKLIEESILSIPGSWLPHLRAPSPIRLLAAGCLAVVVVSSASALPLASAGGSARRVVGDGRAAG